MRASISCSAAWRRTPSSSVADCARRFEVGLRRDHQLARGFERRRQGRRFKRRSFEALFEIGALAGEIAEASANHGGLAHDVGQVVLAFFAAALGILEFEISRVVLERDFLERGVSVAAARRDFARERRARLGAIGARERRLGFQFDQPRAQLDFELRRGVEAPLQERARARALVRTAVEILELALRAAELRPRRLRGRRRGLDLLAYRRTAGARAVERALQLRVATVLRRQLFALIDQPARGRVALEFAELGLDDFVSLGLLGLPAREAELALDFAEHVIDAREIFLDALELALAHLAPALEQRQARRFLDQRAQLVRLGLDNFLDSALLDQRVAAAVNLRGHEKFGDVLEAARNLVEQILRLARAICAARDRDFAERRVGLGKLAAVFGFEHERHFGHPGRGIRLVAGVDKVLDALAAQARRGLLAEHPSNRVNDVRLAASVGTDHRGHPRREADRRRIEKRLEA